jgi:hypothetical protein
VSLLFSLTPFPFLFLFHLHSLLLLLFLSLLISFHCLDSYNCAFSAWRNRTKLFALPPQHFNAIQK